MNEGQIALGILLTLFGFVLLFLLMWWAYADGKQNGRYEERRRKARERVSDPDQARKDLEEISKNSTGYGIFSQRWEPGAPVNIPGPIAQTLPDGSIEITHMPMPWRLEIASRALSGILSNPDGLLRIHKACDSDYDKVRSEIALLALENADALLKAFNESETKSAVKEMSKGLGAEYETEERESEYDLHTKGSRDRMPRGLV